MDYMGIGRYLRIVRTKLDRPGRSVQVCRTFWIEKFVPERNLDRPDEMHPESKSSRDDYYTRTYENFSVGKSSRDDLRSSGTIWMDIYGKEVILKREKS
ncbi:hypothetical protein KFK09_014069 [Dendrobium nobile]|uniref:Uncharacterized protein n=1 Tax=Dendrobium nobile TaxID=94219 RepID=A0A8T3BAZ6_DENNO|nr:hypothetical protein KFK09_014069 [Dendrobium nobile]